MRIIALFIYSVACFYVGFRGWQVLPGIKAIKITYIILLVLISYSYIVGAIFQRLIPLKISRAIEYVGSMWYIFLLYAFIAVLLIDIVRLFNYWFHFLPPVKNIGIFSLQQIVALCVVGVIAILFLIGYYRFTHPKIRIVDIEAPRTSSGENGEVLKIALASDLHLGSIIRKKTTQRFVRQINNLEADIILFAGDVINADLRPLEDQKLNEDLKKLYAPLGVYSVLGNHEYIGGDVDKSIEFLQSANINVLRDSVANVDNRILLIGRDDRINRYRKPLEKLMVTTGEMRDAIPVVLLDHQPYDLQEAVDNNITLMLSGHTHNGQIWPITLVVRNIFELPHSYKNKMGCHFYVSSGLGLWGPPLRIGTQSEVVLIRMHFIGE